MNFNYLVIWSYMLAKLSKNKFWPSSENIYFLIYFIRTEFYGPQRLFEILERFGHFFSILDADGQLLPILTTKCTMSHSISKQVET